jgi:hypothetical protein
MEETTHYKFVNEHITKAVENTVLSVDPIHPFDLLSDDIFKEHVSTHVEHNIVKLTIDELKEAMSKNEEVTIKRETIVVSEDVLKNTVSLKRYSFSKTMVKTRNKSKRRRFKITEKTMVSLTINKITGDFSVYNRKRKGRKDHIFVRKNVSSTQTKTHLYNLQLGGDFKDKIEEAMVVFTSKIGYHGLNLSSYTNVIKYFYNTDPFDQYGQPGLTIFPFLNYLRVNNIEIVSYHALYYFEWIFNKNKAKYRGCNILDYMSDYYKIDDKMILQTMLYKLIQKNEVIVHSIDHEKNTSSWFGKAQSRLCFIDYTKLKILYDLTRDQKYEQGGNFYNYLQYLDDMLPIGSKTGNGERDDYKEIIKYLKYYGIKVNDVFIGFKNVELSGFIKTIKLFDFFGLKLNINSLHDYKMKSNTYTTIIQCLFESVNKSGTYLVDKKSIQRIKLYFKGDYKISFLTNVKFKKIDDYFTFKKIDGSYTEQSAKITICVTSKMGNIYMKINPITQSAYNYDPFLLGVSDHPISNFTTKFSINRNGIASAIRFKFLYSKKLFEKLCEQNGVNNLKFFVDYSRINN